MSSLTIGLISAGCIFGGVLLGLFLREGPQTVAAVFDSSKIPGEILDLLVVRTDVLHRPDGSGLRFAKAIAGAWYETACPRSCWS